MDRQSFNTYGIHPGRVTQLWRTPGTCVVTSRPIGTPISHPDYVEWASHGIITRWLIKHSSYVKFDGRDDELLIKHRDIIPYEPGECPFCNAIPMTFVIR